MERTGKRIKPKPKQKRRTRLPPDERRGLIVEAAFRAIAREGFEGLRTRDIATAAGINSATLHHYFETKQDLIEAIAEYLERRLETDKAPHVASVDLVLDPFGREFEDLVYYQRERPELLAVYREFVARAPRDPVIRELVGKLHAGWKASVVAALERARSQALLRADIEIGAAAGLVVSAAWGFVAGIFVSTDELEAAAAQLRLLVRPLAGRSPATHNAKIRR
jgi:AcrR family transcriptional regulator